MRRREKRIVDISLVRMFVMALVLTSTGCGTESAPWQEPLRATPTKKTAVDTPQALRAAYIAVMQREAGEAYAAVVEDNRARLENPAQRFGGVVDSRSILLTPYENGFHLGMRLATFGCGGESSAVGEGTPRVNGARVEVLREGLTEWYVNGPLGVEHGAVVYESPGCAGLKRVVWDIDGDVSAQLDDSDGDGRGERLWFVDAAGRKVAVYSDVFVTDAVGKPLPAWLSVRDGWRIEVVVDDAEATYPVTIDPLIWVEQQPLMASDGATTDSFGISVALSGDTAIVGAYVHDVGGNLDQGSAYVFVRNGTMWAEQAKLVAMDGAAYDKFGYSVALSGDTAIIGALGDQVGGNIAQGSAYVFSRNGTMWTEQAKLVAIDGAANDFFGYSVALSGDTAIVGAYFDDVGANPDAGSAYVFVRNGAMWTEQAKLVVSNGAEGDYFGCSVALSGDTAIVGAIYDDDAKENQGSAYVFVRNGMMWAEQAQLVASDAAVGDLFGISVALSGDTAIVGAYVDDIGANTNQGSAYVFIRNGAMWAQEAKLVASDGAAEDYFGNSVALAGNTAIVGAVNDDVGANANQGSAYVFVRSGTTWTEQVKHVASDGAPDAQFGISVALSGNTTILGAWLSNFGATQQQGSAYVFFLGKSNGDPCTAANECVSGFCIDGVCCDNPCTGHCEACSASKKGTGMDGVCEAIIAETDPDDECPAMPGSSCGTTGYCNGAGICALFTNGYECARSCTSTHEIQVSTCDGLGNCMLGVDTECFADACQHAWCNPQKAACTMAPMSDHTPCSIGNDQGICIAGACFIDILNPSTTPSSSSSSGTGGAGGMSDTGGAGGSGWSSSGNTETNMSNGTTHAEIHFQGGGCSCNAATSTNHYAFIWLVALALGVSRTRRRVCTSLGGKTLSGGGVIRTPCP